MTAQLARELILPATRLSVPDRPSERKLAAVSKVAADVWTMSPREMATHAVIRLALAELLRIRLTSSELPHSPETITLGQAAHLFSPHVPLARQALQLAVVEAVNNQIPAAVEPLRDALRKVNVTGREPLRMIALGLDRLAPRAEQQFWNAAKTSETITAIVSSLADPGTRDVTGLDRAQLAGADALVLGGGKVTPITIGRRVEPSKGWLQVPLSVTRRQRGSHDEPFRGREKAVDLGLRAEGWSEVVEVTFEALGAAMQQLDLGTRPKGRLSALAESIVPRLVAAKDRTAVEVVTSLRAIEPRMLELFDAGVQASDVRIAVQVPEDEQFAQLWLSKSALNGPLLVGPTDAFLGGGVELRDPAARPERASGRPERKIRSAGQPAQAQPAKSGQSRRRGGRRRPGGANQKPETPNGSPESS